MLKSHTKSSTWLSVTSALKFYWGSVNKNNFCADDRSKTWYRILLFCNSLFDISNETDISIGHNGGKFMIKELNYPHKTNNCSE